MFALMPPLFLTYTYVSGKDRMNNNQASYFVSTRLILYSLFLIGFVVSCCPELLHIISLGKHLVLLLTTLLIF